MSGTQTDISWVVRRYFPDLDTVTRAQYRRDPAPITPRPAPRTIICAACGQPFKPHPLAGRPRFCSAVCRRWFHYGAGAQARKTAAPAA